MIVLALVYSKNISALGDGDMLYDAFKNANGANFGGDLGAMRFIEDW